MMYTRASVVQLTLGPECKHVHVTLWKLYGWGLQDWWQAGKESTEGGVFYLNIALPFLISQMDWATVESWKQINERSGSSNKPVSVYLWKQNTISSLDQCSTLETPPKVSPCYQISLLSSTHSLWRLASNPWGPCFPPAGLTPWLGARLCSLWSLDEGWMSE